MQITVVIQVNDPFYAGSILRQLQAALGAKDRTTITIPIPEDNSVIISDVQTELD